MKTFHLPHFETHEKAVPLIMTKCTQSPELSEDVPKLDKTVTQLNK